MIGYNERRAHWVREAHSINRRFFPRCFNARLRNIARLDAEQQGRNFNEVYNELLEEWGNE